MTEDRTVNAVRRGHRIDCGVCGGLLAHRERDGVVWWIQGWQRLDVPLEDEQRNTVVYRKPRRSHAQAETVMSFHLPVTQRCRDCGQLNTVA